MRRLVLLLAVLLAFPVAAQPRKVGEGARKVGSGGAGGGTPVPSFGTVLGQYGEELAVAGEPGSAIRLGLGRGVARFYNDWSDFGKLKFDVTDAFGSVKLNDGTQVLPTKAADDLRLVAGTGITIDTATAADGATGVRISASGGSAPPVEMHPDPMAKMNAVLGEDFLDVGNGTLALAPIAAFWTDIADAKTNPPTGWSIINAANMASADVGVTSPGKFVMTHSASVAPSWVSDTIPGAWRPLSGETWEVVARIHQADANNSTQSLAYTVSIVEDLGTSSYNGEWYRVGLTSAYDFIDIRSKASGASALASVAGATLAQRQAGIWVRFRAHAGRLTISTSYANTTTPPTTGWTVVAVPTSLPAGPVRVFVAPWRTSSDAGATTASIGVSYYAETVPEAWAQDGALVEGRGAQGFRSGRSITLYSGRDLGSSTATIDVGILAGALQAAVNRRSADSASWELCIGRSDTVAIPWKCSPYNAIDIDIVPGVLMTGRYLTLTLRATSDGTQPGSVDLSNFYIGVKP